MTAPAKCDTCGKLFDADEPGTWSLAQGWTPRRAAGGANTLRHKVELGRYKCRECARLDDLGVIEGQTELFGST